MSSEIGTSWSRSLMLVTASEPCDRGYDKASPSRPHYALSLGSTTLTLKQAALQLGAVSAVEFDRVVDPQKMVKPSVAADSNPTPPLER